MSAASQDVVSLRESFKSQTAAVQGAVASLVECQDFFHELRMNAESLSQVFMQQRQAILQSMQEDDLADSRGAGAGVPNGDTRGADSIKIEKLQRQLEAMRAQNRMLEGGQQGGEAEWLKEENQQLKARIAELMGTPGKPKAADGNRIRELEEEIATLRDQLRTAAGARDQASAESEAARAGAAGREAQLAEEAESLRARAAGLEEEVGALRKELEEARAARQAAEASGGEKMRAAESRVAEVEAEVARVRGEGEALERELSALKDQAEELRGREKRSATQLKIKQAVAVALMEELQKRCSSAEVKEVAEETRGHLQGEITMEALRGLTQALHKVVEHVAMADSAKWKDLYGHEHRARKRIHNELMELKGNIRVFCRVRPLDEAHEGGQQEAVRVVNDMTLQAMSDKGPSHGYRSFDFDCVFGPDSTQEGVFEEVQHLVTSAMDGFNVCILAYGQTGSGKTHTMEGPSSDPGVNMRALDLLFQLRDSKAAARRIAIEASAIEIYNEAVRDLLGDDPQKKLEVKQGKEGMFVQDLRTVRVDSRADVVALMERARSNRATFSTNMNEHSSRSHSILTVYVDAQDSVSGERTRSKLHLVDLAGSERLSKTGATGERLVEAQAINKSLSSLGDVIQALQAKQAHVPYRNSRLTFLLQDSLGGNSKTLMIMAVSPSMSNSQETICTLKFGQRAMKVDLGKATKNVVQD